MRRGNKVFWLFLILCFISVPAALARKAPSGQNPVLVGRISHVEGQLLRYVPAEKDWVATVKDAPFGFDDALYADEESRAEFIMPNNTWLRIGANTQVQLIALKGDATEIDVASGIARFFNKSRHVMLKATTPFGYVVAPAGTAFDLYVGDESVEVIALEGSVEFVHDGDETRYGVNEGASSIIADSRNVTSGDGTVDAAWEEWNVQRDDVWAKRIEIKGDSVRYLPSTLRSEAYTLEEHGRWERVYYQGRYRHFWRPVTVSAGWEPFTVGRWTEWYGDNTWIPAEPFGYVTHHYGNWVYVNDFWYWAPPVVSVGVHIGPGAGIGLAWYPGRVAWISSGVDIGWVPLAPYEPYYTYNYWGPSAVVVGNVGLADVAINVGGLAYLNYAVVVGHSNFYGVSNYSSVRITNINRTTIINNYRAAPVVNNTVIPNYTSIRQRYNFSNANVGVKPHQSVIGRIERNELAASQAGGLSARSIRQGVEKARFVRSVPNASVQAPRITRKTVPANEVGKPKNEVQFQQRTLKQNPKALQPRGNIRPGAGRRSPGALGRSESRAAGGSFGRARKSGGSRQQRGGIRAAEPARMQQVRPQARGRAGGEQRSFGRAGRQPASRGGRQMLRQRSMPRMQEQRMGRFGREQRRPAQYGQGRSRGRLGQGLPRQQMQRPARRMQQRAPGPQARGGSSGRRFGGGNERRH